MITDTRITIETPEGAELPLDPAGIGIRAIAFVTDGAIRVAVLLVLIVIISFMGRGGKGLSLVVFFLLEWFYPVYFEVWQRGQTPGKKWQGIVVVSEDGTPIRFASSLIRNLLRVIDFLPLAYVAGLVSCICTKEFKRLGDLAAGTLVVYTHLKPEPPTLGLSETQAVPSDFTTDEQRALLSFAERAPQLSHARQLELASILSPVLGDDDPVNTIKRMANSMVAGG